MPFNSRKLLKTFAIPLIAGVGFSCAFAENNADLTPKSSDKYQEVFKDRSYSREITQQEITAILALSSVDYGVAQAILDVTEKCKAIPSWPVVWFAGIHSSTVKTNQRKYTPNSNTKLDEHSLIEPSAEECREIRDISVAVELQRDWDKSSLSTQKEG